MQTLEELPQSGTSALQHPALRKLRRLGYLIRVLSAGFAAWVLVNILTWWLNEDLVILNFGRYLGRDLSAATSMQRMGAMTLDLVAWALMLMAVVHFWTFLHRVCHPQKSFEEASTHLSRGAWFGVSCEAVTELCRPVQSFFMTAHLPWADQVWKWRFGVNDLMAILLCLSLLMLAYVFTWTMEVAEENRSFV